MNRTQIPPPMALFGAAAISLAAHRARALTPGGAAAATAVGDAVATGAGPRGAAMLVAFFVSSTLLGRLPGKTKLEQRRGNERDAVQVIANGGVAALLALAAARPAERPRQVLLAGFGGAVATAAADTWATEIGSRYGRKPRSIATLAPVAPGTSGGVTLAGLAASVAGAALVASVAAIGPGRGEVIPRAEIAACALGGVAGALADSLLGATVQDVRICPVCAQETELAIHHGVRTRHQRGARWCNNDVVNLAATAAGAATATAIAALAPELGRRRS